MIEVIFLSICYAPEFLILFFFFVFNWICPNIFLFFLSKFHAPWMALASTILAFNYAAHFI